MLSACCKRTHRLPSYVTCANIPWEPFLHNHDGNTASFTLRSGVSRWPCFQNVKLGCPRQRTVNTRLPAASLLYFDYQGRFDACCGSNNATMFMCGTKRLLLRGKVRRALGASPHLYACRSQPWRTTCTLRQVASFFRFMLMHNVTSRVTRLPSCTLLKHDQDAGLDTTDPNWNVEQAKPHRMVRISGLRLART
ncbi:hypothetical protein BS17DRAFT_374709 [Gyrodon lividus]|nr:hypothetical protein BS17DRAFT_374709 [Gyrodon lividus]